MDKFIKSSVIFLSGIAPPIFGAWFANHLGIEWLAKLAFAVGAGQILFLVMSFVLGGKYSLKAMLAAALATHIASTLFQSQPAWEVMFGLAAGIIAGYCTAFTILQVWKPKEAA